MSGGFHHRLSFGRAALSGEMFRVKMPNRPFEPNVKEISQMGVWNIIVVGRICNNRIEEVVLVWKGEGGPSLYYALLEPAVRKSFDGSNHIICRLRP